MFSDTLQTNLVTSDPGRSERDRRLAGALTELALRDENLLYAKTCGISANNRGLGFQPGYRHGETGEIQPSCFSDGRPAPIHLLDGLPESWVRDRDPQGHVTAVHPAVVSGFIRDGRFYSREEAARAAAH